MSASEGRSQIRHPVDRRLAPTPRVDEDHGIDANQCKGLTDVGGMNPLLLRQADIVGKCFRNWATDAASNSHAFRLTGSASNLAETS